jgi:hypothetical protein
VFDGGAAEVAQVDRDEQTRKIAGAQRFLLVADSKLVSWNNFALLVAVGVDFIAPAPAAKGLRRVLGRARTRPPHRGLTRARDRDQDKPATPGRLTGPSKRDVPCRCAGSWSTPPATPQASSGPETNAWPKRPPNSTRSLLVPSDGTTAPPIADNVAARAGVIAKTRRVAKVLQIETGTDPDNG